MSLSSCPKCWDTPCRCGHGYRYWSVKDLNAQIEMLTKVRDDKITTTPPSAPPVRTTNHADPDPTHRD